jgi:anti-anti-sigma factor
MPDEATVSTRTLSLHISSEIGATVVRCQGNLTLENSAFLKTEAKCRIPENGRLILDLTDVGRMDSSGLGALIALYLSARGKHCGLELINLNQQIRKVLAISNLLATFEDTGRYGIRIP